MENERKMKAFLLVSVPDSKVFTDDQDMRIKSGLRNELSFLAGVASLGCWLAGRRTAASTLAATAIGLRLLPSQKYSLTGRSVVITGGSRGLGLAIAEGLVGKGARITLLARDKAELDRAELQLARDPEAEILTIACDVANPAEMEEALLLVKHHYGEIDVLINNAGAVAAGPFEAMNEADFAAQMKIHFYAVLRSIQSILPHFKEKGRGQIVNVSSVGGKIPVPHMIPYCASKFALAGFSEALGTELRKDGITVTTIYPGLMRTGSPIQGVFKGDQEKEFAWFAVSDSTPGLTISAANAANQIIRAVEEQRPNVVLSIPAKLGVFVYQNFPALFSEVMVLANKFLPTGTSQVAQTGAESAGWLKEQKWSKPFREILEKAQRRYNEHEKFDAAFNMNMKPVAKA